MKIDGLRMMSTAEREALREDIREHGQRMPIIRDKKTGIIADGENRLEILKELGLKPKYEDREFDSEDDIRMFAISVNVNRRQLTPDQLKEFRANQKERYLQLRKEGKTQQEAADTVGVPRPTGAKWDASIPNVQANNGNKIPDLRLRIDPPVKEAIVKMCKSGVSQEKVGAEFGVAQGTVSKIIKDAQDQNKREQAARLRPVRTPVTPKAKSEAPAKQETPTLKNQYYKASVAELLDEFMRLLSYEAMAKAYKTQAAIFHPDNRTTGNAEKAMRLNQLWDVIEKKHFKK